MIELQSPPLTDRAPRHSFDAAQIEIRPLEPGDFWAGFFEALASLRESGLTPDEARRILLARPDNIRTFVLLTDGIVAATATLVIEQKFIHRGGLVGHVEDVATNPAMRGRGLASRLVERLVEEARQAGCYKVILDCNDHVAPFYQRLGFRVNALCMRIDL